MASGSGLRRRGSGAVGATIAARKAPRPRTWKAVDRQEAAGEPRRPRRRLWEAVTWAASAASRSAWPGCSPAARPRDYYRRSTGHLPPDLEDVEV